MWLGLDQARFGAFGVSAGYNFKNGLGIGAGFKTIQHPLLPEYIYLRVLFAEKTPKS